MKKIVKIVFATSIAAVLLATGCSKKATPSKNEASGEAKMTVFWWGNQTRNERTQKVLSMFSQENAGVSIDPQFAEWADYWNKLATSAAGHTMPDVIQMDYTYLNQYASKNLLVDLTPYTKDGTLDVSKVNKGILDAGSVNGKIYSICIGVNAPSLLYNKTLLDKNGIAVKDNMTLDEFLKLCAEIYKKTGMKTDIAYGTNMLSGYLMRGIGKTMYGENKLGVSAADFKVFFDVYEKGTKEGWLLPPTVFAERVVGSVEQMPLVYGTSGDNMSWCAFVWSNQMSAFTKAAPEGMDLGITTWPATDPVKANYLKPSQFFSVTSDSKNPKVAAKIIDYVTNSVACNKVLLGERGIPASSATADAVAPEFDAVQQKVVKYINNVVSPNCSAIDAPEPNAAAQVYKVMFDLVDQICFGKVTAADAAQTFVAEGNKILAK